MAKKKPKKKKPTDLKQRSINLRPWKYAVKRKFKEGIPGNPDPTLGQVETYLEECYQGKRNRPKWCKHLATARVKVGVLATCYGSDVTLSQLHQAKCLDVDCFGRPNSEEGG